MECKKFGFLFTATAAVLLVVVLATVTPSAFAGRNEVVPFPISTTAEANIKNPFANIFLANKPAAENCIGSGGFCMFNPMDCCGNCGCLYPIGICFGSDC